IHHSSPQNTAPSLMRSQEASSVAPKRVPPPLSRAIAPSSMSKSAKNQTTHPPANSLPIGKRVNAPATEAIVPRMVTLSGVKPTRRAALASGLLSRANAARDRKGTLLMSDALPREREVPPPHRFALHRRRRNSRLFLPLRGQHLSDV